MPSRKYNEYLDAGQTDDDIVSSGHSDDLQEVKGKATNLSKGSKRQKTSHESSDDDSDDEPPSPSEVITSNDPEITSLLLKSIPTVEEHVPSKQPDKTSTKPSRSEPTSSRPSKPGVVYLSRIPPFMRPSTVRHILSPFGPITRLFLTPEPRSQHTSRVRSGGNKKRSFIDGWIEFADHKSAKTCVAAINGQTLGGRGWYRDDVCNAKYLRGFGWDDLMDGVRAEEREREERVRIGVRRDKKEREEFLKGVERARVEGTRRRKREARVKGQENVEGGGAEGKYEAKEGYERRFRQNEVKRKREGEEQPEEVKRVLSKIF
ncbi:MAG: hypothetical protein Q9170_005782 [Blastenia crenularia]